MVTCATLNLPIPNTSTMHCPTYKAISYARTNVRWLLMHYWKFTTDCCKCSNKRKNSQNQSVTLQKNIPVPVHNT